MTFQMILLKTAFAKYKENQMFNKIIIAGNLTRDIELRYSQSGSAIAKSAIATSRKFTVNGEKREEVCFIDITFFGRSGEIANQYLRKGSKILVEGRLTFEQWVDQNGGKHSKHSVTVENMQMLDSKDKSNNSQTNQAQQQSSYGQYKQPQQQNYQTNQPPVYQPTGNNQQPPPQYQQPQSAPQQNGQPPLPEVDIDDSEIPF